MTGAARRLWLWVALGCLAAGRPARAQGQDPIAYTVRIANPETGVADIEARIPTGARDPIELTMPIWSPGFYRVEDYTTRVQEISATALDGTSLPVMHQQRQPNRWTVRTQGASLVIVKYRLLANVRWVTADWVAPDLVVLNGAATWITLVDTVQHPAEVQLVLPGAWKPAATALPPAPDSQPNHWRAADYDELVDSPIVAGHLHIHRFAVDGHQFELVDVGEPPSWDGSRTANDLARMVRANDRVWHDLPFGRYSFLNVFRPGSGGLEHKNSTLLTTSALRTATREGYRRWLAFVAHEYVHAFNVKRLRPVELGPFDYEHEPHTPSLWISEGVTTYLADLALARAGLSSPDEFLADLSDQIQQLQAEPGRLVQTVEESSLEVWTNSFSGANPAPTTVGYYVKGAVLGFLLDARVRHATQGARSLDEVMRLAYQRYGGARGFTPEQFRAVAAEVAQADVSDWFRRAVASTEEVDYSEALDWFGLRFAPGASGPDRWRLEVHPDVTPAQQAQLRALLGLP